MAATNSSSHSMSALRRNSHIVLIGPMSAGKTAVAHELEQLLCIPWIDLDHEFEVEHGPIAAFVPEHGIESFRDHESRFLERALIRSAPQIIATGGGVVERSGNRDLLQQHTIFWLDVSPEAAALRMNNGVGRPLLAGDDPLENWVRIRHERAPLYQALGVSPIDTSQVDPAYVASNIAAYLEKPAATSAHDFLTSKENE